MLTTLASLLPPDVLAKLSLLWVDERALAPGHPERNDGATLAAWRAGGDLPAHVYPMPADMEDLEAAAASYARTLAVATQGSPLDVCLLGIGEDGHVASLFPAHPGLEDTRTVFAVYDSPKPPPKRLTLSLPVLRSATSLVVLALGAAKLRIAEKAWEGPDPTIPVSLLPPERTTWFIEGNDLTSPASASNPSNR